ncbi:MAG: sugar-binding protein [Actinomycetota bacterium]
MNINKGKTLKVKEQKSNSILAFLIIIIISIIIFAFLFFTILRPFFSGFFTGEQTLKKPIFEVAISSPTDGEKIPTLQGKAESNIEVVVSSNRPINKVNIFINGVLVEGLNKEPYIFKWETTTTGVYSIYAEAVNDQNEKKESLPIEVTVYSPEEEEIKETLLEKINRVISEIEYRKTNGFPKICLETENVIEIDGITEKWEDFDSFSAFKVTYNSKALTSPSDLSGRFYSVWDDKYLYIIIDVTDDVLTPLGKEDDILKGDGLLLSIDSNLYGDLNERILDADDYQLFISPGNFSNIPAQVKTIVPEQYELSGINIASSKKVGEYYIELKIPWIQIGIQNPQDKTPFGFNLDILDTDHLGECELIISSSPRANSQDALTFGTLILIKPP